MTRSRQLYPAMTSDQLRSEYFDRRPGNPQAAAREVLITSLTKMMGKLLKNAWLKLQTSHF
jgi:hypothetical protein